MPLAGFRCPDNGESPGRDNTADYCLTQCAKRCMPKAILSKIWQENEGNVHRGDMITPSALKGCRRKLVLERNTPYYHEPIKLYYAVRGTIIHGFLEDPKLPEVYTEVRLFKKLVVGGREIVFSGQIDYYDRAEETIEDYKTLSDKGTYFLFGEGAKPEHVAQTNLYRWLCDGGHVGSLDGPQVFWPVKRIQVNYLFMNRVVSTGTEYYEDVTTYKSPNFGKKYKLETSRTIIKHSPRGVPVWRIKLSIPEVPLWDMDHVLKDVTVDANDVYDAFRAAELPGAVLYNQDDAWQCDYCAVKRDCHAYEQATNPEMFTTLIQVKK